jgi:hypothetical protein
MAEREHAATFEIWLDVESGRENFLRLCDQHLAERIRGDHFRPVWQVRRIPQSLSRPCEAESVPSTTEGKEA